MNIDAKTIRLMILMLPVFACLLGFWMFVVFPIWRVVEAIH